MALSEEQNAMLRLLAQGEQGYADIAALMGLSEADVRAKVVGALAQLQAEGKAVPDVPPPIPGGAQPAAEVAPPEPEPVAEVPSEKENPEPAVADAVAPKPESGTSDPHPAAPSASEVDAASPKPAAAGPKGPTAAQAPRSAATPAASPPPSGRRPSGGRTITLPSGRNAWLLGGGILAAIVAIVVVILVTSGGGGGGSSTTSTEAGTTPPAKESVAEKGAGTKEPTEAKLTAVDGSEAEGRAAFGQVKESLALQVEATGLAATTKGNSYTVWLAASPTKMLPLAFPLTVKGSGKGAGDIAVQLEVPLEILGYLASGTFDEIAITKTQNKPFEAALEVATKKKQAPAYTGDAVLRGTITGPIIGLAVREEEAKKAEGAEK